MKLYIDGPDSGGEGVYVLISEEGEVLAQHFCSSRGFAPGDLEAHRTERQVEWRERFGDYQVLWLGEDELPGDELLRRNQEHAANAAKAEEAR